ncbi:MAG: hypothetical protein ACKO65_05295 [Betaproteobacteria bacterium]
MDNCPGEANLMLFPISRMRGFEAVNSCDRVCHRLSRKLGIVVRLQVDPAHQWLSLAHTG